MAAAPQREILYDYHGQQYYFDEASGQYFFPDGSPYYDAYGYYAEDGNYYYYDQQNQKPIEQASGNAYG